MKPRSSNAIIAAVWVWRAHIAGVVRHPLTAGVAGISIVAVVPPLVMMWQWNDPAKTMSEGINEARR